jgi:hypothetical protein
MSAEDGAFWSLAERVEVEAMEIPISKANVWQLLEGLSKHDDKFCYRYEEARRAQMSGVHVDQGRRRVPSDVNRL